MRQIYISFLVRFHHDARHFALNFSYRRHCCDMYLTALCISKLPSWHNNCLLLQWLHENKSSVTSCDVRGNLLYEGSARKLWDAKLKNNEEWNSLSFEIVFIKRLSFHEAHCKVHLKSKLSLYTHELVTKASYKWRPESKTFYLRT